MVKNKKNNRLSFILSVCLMSALILALLIPTTIAWFTDSATKTANTKINLGSVNVGINIPAQGNTGCLINKTSETRALNYILPGDNLQTEIELYNNGSVDIYTKAKIEVGVLYDGEDITDYISEYIQTTITAPNGTYLDGSSVIDLAKTENFGNGVKLTANINILTTLPNEVAGYLFNGATAQVKILIKVNAVAVQKDNYTLTTNSELETYLNQFFPTQQVPIQTGYSLDNSSGTPKLLLDGQVVETLAYWDLSENNDGSIYAFAVKKEEPIQTLAIGESDKVELIIVGNGATKNFSNEDGGVLYDNPLAEHISAITSVRVEKGITAIGHATFIEFTNLTSVFFASSVQTIGIGAFAGTGLTNINLPYGVTTIGYAAFVLCESLTSITIPNSVTTIGRGAFASCTNLTAIYMEHSSLEEVFNRLGVAWAIDLHDSIMVYFYSEEPIEDGEHWHYVDDVPTVYEYPYKIDTSSGTPKLLYRNEEMQTLESWDVSEYSNGTVYAFALEKSQTNPYTLIIAGTEDMDYFRVKERPYINYAESVLICPGVKSIGAYAFKGCTNLTQIEMGNVTTIDEGAFEGCTSLTNIDIPNSVKTIGISAFDNCTSLNSIEIPSSVTSIGNYAFRYCSSLNSITVKSENSVFNSENNCLIITGTNTLILGCKNSIIPDYITTIEKYAFSGCTGLTSIEIPNGVKEISGFTFEDCIALTNITIPTSVTIIANFAFLNCTSLNSIDIPNSVTKIGGSAFENCTSLNSIDIPNSVTAIYDRAFANCTSLNSIDIPNSITTIEIQVFRGCTGLTNIVIPESVTTISISAFENCTSLTSIIIPSNVTIIATEAFINCSSLTAIYMEHTSNTGLTLFDNWNGDATVYYYSEEPNYDGAHWRYVNGVPIIWLEGTPSLGGDGNLGGNI